MKKDISLFVPAYNEEKNILRTLQSITRIMQQERISYEIIVIDDGSTDATGPICDRFAETDRHVRVIHHSRNEGFGKTVRDGIAAASKTYISGLPGDNDTSPELLRRFIRQLGTADLLIGIMTRNEKRSWWRRFLSSGFVTLMNMLFGLRLTYYNGYIACRTELLRSIPIKSEGFAIFAEIKVRLLSRGITHKEISFTHTGRKHGASKAVSWRSVLQTARTIILLLRDTHLTRKV